jgi:hypothetical protein
MFEERQTTPALNWKRALVGKTRSNDIGNPARYEPVCLVVWEDVAVRPPLPNLGLLDVARQVRESQDNYWWDIEIYYESIHSSGSTKFLLSDRVGLIRI